MKRTRRHPSAEQLAYMSDYALAEYLDAEADLLGDPNGQKQTAIPRALREAALRLRGNARQGAS